MLSVSNNCSCKFDMVTSTAKLFIITRSKAHLFQQEGSAEKETVGSHPNL